jgi:hypothetical protein
VCLFRLDLTRRTPNHLFFLLAKFVNDVILELFIAFYSQKVRERKKKSFKNRQISFI